MNYYIDTEFLEGTQEPKWLMLKSRLGHWLIGKPKPTIDLISIGIVAEDGREYYAISKDFNLKEAWNRHDIIVDDFSNQQYLKSKYPQGRKTKNYWIRENVLKLIWRELMFKADECWGMSNKQTEVYYKEILTGAYDHHFSFKSLKALIKKYGKTNKQIAEEIKLFTRKVKVENENLVQDVPKFYAYYADYDWVAFCWLFGKMMDLPKGFPMYCNDLKQILDEKAHRMTYNTIDTKKQKQIDVKEWIESIKNHPNYPKQENEHNALADARWNKKLHEFLNKL